MNGPVRQTLPDGRTHFQHGPIDLVIAADGQPAAVAAALEAAWSRFGMVLGELVGELPLLRRPLGRQTPSPNGLVAQRMITACQPFATQCFLTAMAAVAGAVADEILTVMLAAAPLERAAVNNGGDIALHLSPGTRMRTLIADHRGRRLGLVTVGHGDGIGGIATSGRHGRSLSLGIADSVTVLAANAATADAAATLIANAVDLPTHPAVTRAPARALTPDSDLGSRLVVTGCRDLDEVDRAHALERGMRAAQAMRHAAVITSAFLHLQGQTRIAGPLPQGSTIETAITTQEAA